jgi:release factor glutamine methyltransferase
LPEALVAESLRQLLRRGVRRLDAAGCATPRLDAELLLAEALGIERARLVIDAHDEVGEEQRDRFSRLLARRERREPVAYILGRKEFRRISLRVDARGLIPRPETELLVEEGLRLARGSRVVDVGTGCGAVALALKDERPDVDVAGTDRSAAALSLARENASRLGLDVEFVGGDLLAGPSADAVLANLPYVPDRTPLAPEIAGHEPPEALFGGPDGLDVVRRLTATLPARVRFVALEVGAGQAAEVAGLLRGAGFARPQRRRDLAGHERVVVARR